MSRLSKRQQQQNPSRQQGTFVQQRFYQGIVPSADEMEKYNLIQPGFADRIIKLTENEGTHRRKVENRVVNWSLFSAIYGQTLAFLSVLAICYLCYFSLEKGYDKTAGWIAVGTLVAIAAVFVKGKGNTPKSTKPQ